MSRIAISICVLLAPALVLGCFTFGRLAERRAATRHEESSGRKAPQTQRRLRVVQSSADSIDTSKLLIANVATVPFGELWDIMEGSTPEQRKIWATELVRMPPGPQRNAALQTFYKVWVALDPAAAIPAIEDITDRRLKQLASRALRYTAADSALPLLAELEQRLGLEPDGWGGSSILDRWAVVDPAAAAGFLEEHPNISSNDFYTVGWSWAHHDPQQAAQWWAGLSLPPLEDRKFPGRKDDRRAEAVRGLLGGWVREDSEAATAFALAHATDPDVKDSLKELGSWLFIKSAEQARYLIQSLPSEDLQRVALEDVMSSVGQRNILLTHGGDAEEPEEPTPNPAEVAAWVVTLPQNLWLEDAGRILLEWHEHDQQRAELWLQALPPDVRRKAIFDYAAGAELERAPALFELLRLIGSPAARDHALDKFMLSSGGNVSETRAKIADLALSPEQKAILLSHLPRQE